MDATEIQILKRAKAGDDESFEILLRKYEKYLYISIKDYYLAGGDRDEIGRASCRERVSSPV